MMTACFERLREWLSANYESIGIDFQNDRSLVSWVELDNKRFELGDHQLGFLTRFVILSKEGPIEAEFQQEIRWALEAASNFDFRSTVPLDQSDPLGGWQVQVIWIVQEGCKEGWLQCMRQLRARSSHAEEIGLDLIDMSCRSLDEALAVDGVPALLFKTRELMRRDASEMPAWLSPDTEVELRLRALPDSSSDDSEREFMAACLERLLTENKDAKIAEPTFSPKRGTLSISNVRNIASAEVAVEFGDATVIHGPNGTGKSSLFEAVSIALLGASHRQLAFLEDRDVASRAKSNYVANVLKRFGSGGVRNPSITVGSDELVSSLDADVETVRSRVIAGRGNVLPQESAREFLGMSASELAGYVLGDYSALARRVQSEVDQSAQAAKSEWQDWLRSYGLNASMTKQGTILRRLVEKSLEGDFRRESPIPSLWLNSLEAFLPELHQRLMSSLGRWEEVDGGPARSSLVEGVAVAIEHSGNPGFVISRWLAHRASAAAQVASVLEECQLKVDELRQEWGSIKEDVAAWGTWLRMALTSVPVAVRVQVSAAQDRLAEIRSQLAELEPVGRNLRARKDHLSSIGNEFISAWKAISPHSCPTCDASHANEIDQVIRGVLSETVDAYDRLRSQYAALKQEEKDLLLLSGGGDSPCPVSPSRQEEVAGLLHMQVDGPGSLEFVLRSDSGERELFSRIERLFAIPAWKDPASAEEIEAAARETSAKIVEIRAVGHSMQELPLKWERFKKRVDEISLGVVGNHLPKTIGALWREIAFVLAPAHWIQACEPKMAMELRRGAEKLSVSICPEGTQSEIPARHVLNQAEQHSLGLAWFFTRFLTHGRFLVPFIALDDPAQEMDQVTFRKFARFTQAFQRLHRQASNDFGMLVLLHQEERAIEFARLTTANGSMTVLEWSGTVEYSGPSSTVRRVQLRNPQQRPRRYCPVSASPEKVGAD